MSVETAKGLGRKPAQPNSRSFDGGTDVALTTKTGGEPAALSEPERKKAQPESPGRLMSSRTIVGRKPSATSSAAASADAESWVSWPRARRCLMTIWASGRSSSIRRIRDASDSPSKAAGGVSPGRGASPLPIDRPDDQVAAGVVRPEDRLEDDALGFGVVAEARHQFLAETQAGERYPRRSSRGHQRESALD